MNENLEKTLGINPNSSSTEKYPALRIIAVIFKVLAWLVAIIAGICALVEIGSIPLISLLWFMGGFLGLIFLLAISEGIKVFIDIEANTRKVAEFKS